MTKKVSFSDQSKYYEYCYEDKDNKNVNIMIVDTKTEDGAYELCDFYVELVLEYFSKFLDANNFKKVIARLMDIEIVEFVLKKKMR